MKLIGGPFDGQERHYIGGKFLTVSFCDLEYEDKMSKWNEQHGLKWALLNMDSMHPQVDIPSPPMFPVAVYAVTSQDEATFQEVIR